MYPGTFGKNPGTISNRKTHHGSNKKVKKMPRKPDPEKQRKPELTNLQQFKRNCKAMARAWEDALAEAEAMEEYAVNGEVPLFAQPAHQESLRTARNARRNLLNSWPHVIEHHEKNTENNHVEPK